jgi:hypothetical protein
MPEGMRLRVIGGAGANSLTIDSGAVELAALVNPEDPAGRGGDFALVVKGTAQALIDPACSIATLDIREEAKVTVKSAGSRPLSLKALSIESQGTLDLNGNDLVLAAASNADATLFQISKLIGSARNAATGPWTGAGITSGLLLDKPLLGLAVILRDDTILVKQTWNGDVNLDGKVDIDDYFLIDSGFITKIGGYRNGDLNFDGKVDIDDYFLVDSAFVGQNSPVWSN